MGNGVVISAAVEGIVDEAVARKLITHAGGTPGSIYGKQGKQALRHRIGGFNNAARHAPWLVLVDLDRDHECPPSLCSVWVPHPSAMLCFRIAVREVEAWLMADRERLAAFLGVSQSRVPADPEAINDPKMELVNLARCSRRNAIQHDMVPRHGSGRQVGPAYSSRLIEFVSSSWQLDAAARQSDSLRRAIECLRRLVRTA